MIHTIQQINAKVDRIKGNLMGESITSDKVMDKMENLDAFIGSLDNYTDRERKEIEEIQRAFCRWCQGRERI